jgi:hypothetical protein
MYDRGGKLYLKAYAYDSSIELEVGTLNYASGDIVLYASVSFSGTVSTWHASSAGSWNNWGYYTQAPGVVVITPEVLTACDYTTGSTDTTTSEVTLTATAWEVAIPVLGVSALPDSAVFQIGGEPYTISSGTVRKGWHINTGAADVATAGSATSGGRLSITSLPAGASNLITWYNMALKASVPAVSGGVFRVSTAPLKTGVFQLFSGSAISNGNDAGVIGGSSLTGTVDYTRGVVTWTTAGGWQSINPATLSYNAVYLQYMPLDTSLLGIDTARLPLDGKVPIYRNGDLVVVHNTLTYNLPNPLVKTTVYALGRERIASVRVKDSSGVVVPDTLYTPDLNAGTFMVPTPSVITSYPQPWTVEHRMEDMLLCSQADISGKLTFTRSLTHDFPADTSFVSSAMPFGDLFARAYASFEQGTWTGVWSDTLIGSSITAQFNSALYPIVVTNAGAITERWAVIFTNGANFNVVGEFAGLIGSGNTSSDFSVNNPATGVSYFTLPALGWGTSGGGWATGNVLRFDTAACGTPFWAVRTILQGPASFDSDQFTVAFRGDVDRP